jgi:hypothetical protein
MIKEIPGYLNLLAITVVYYLMFYLLVDLIFFEKAFFDARRYLFSFFFGAFYMAKWRYINGSWSFNGSLLAWIKNFILGWKL